MGLGRCDLCASEYLALAPMNGYTQIEMPFTTLSAYVVQDGLRLGMIIHD